MSGKGPSNNKMCVLGPKGRATALLLFLVALGTCSVAGAETAPGEGADTTEETPRPSPVDDGLRIEPVEGPEGAPIDDDRDPPRLRRDEEPTTVGDVLIWIPRVVLLPLFFVNNYLLRAPLAFATRTVERHDVVPWILHYTTWGDREGPKPDGGIRPIFRLDSDFAPTVGLLVYYDQFPVPEVDMELGADTDFGRNATARFDAREKLFGGFIRLTQRAQVERRDDFVFYGLGPDTRADDETRFFRDKRAASVEMLVVPAVLNTGARVTAQIADYEFDCSPESEVDICGPDGDPNTDDDRARIDEPDGASFFTDGYRIGRVKGMLVWDTRPPRPATGTGLRLQVLGRYGFGLGSENDEVHFARYGAQGSAYVDFFNQRVLAFRLRAEIADPVSGGQIPFGELMTFGGIETMRGFRNARFHGRSAGVATIEYRYPVWSFLDAMLFVEAGNVFGRHFREFSVGAARGSAGMGLRSIKSRHVAYNAIIGVGTTQFDDRLAIDSVRLQAGTNWGF